MSLGSKELDTKTGKGAGGYGNPCALSIRKRTLVQQREVPPMSISQPPLDIRFHNESLLQNALTHSSYANENRGKRGAQQ